MRGPGVCPSWPLQSGWCPLQKESPRSGLGAREVMLRKFFQRKHVYGTNYRVLAKCSKRRWQREESAHPKTGFNCHDKDCLRVTTRGPGEVPLATSTCPQGPRHRLPPPCSPGVPKGNRDFCPRGPSCRTASVSVASGLPPDGVGRPRAAAYLPRTGPERQAPGDVANHPQAWPVTGGGRSEPGGRGARGRGPANGRASVLRDGPGDRQQRCLTQPRQFGPGPAGAPRCRRQRQAASGPRRHRPRALGSTRRRGRKPAA